MPKLQTNKLKEKYPKIIKCALEVNGDGWYWIIDQLCAQLQWDIDKNKQPQVEFGQIKEKFGTLRAYPMSASDQQWSMIRLAEYMSASICEICGDNKSAKLRGSTWVCTKCDKCWKKTLKK